jgi:16S rRNA (uracil1498-N3)-methyltransferase
MRRLFVPARELEGERVTLGEDAHRHVVKVLRLGAGVRLAVFDGEGTEIDAEIEAVGARTLTLLLFERRRIAPSPCRITLWQVLARGDRMDLIVQKATELGVAAVRPLTTARSVAKIEGGAADHKVERWTAIARDACRQSGRADVPVIAAPLPLRDLPAPEGPGKRLALWEGTRGMPLRLAIGPEDRAIELLVGPEGGLSVDDVEIARARRFASVTLGPRILRTETAAIAALTVAQALTGGLD